jgi:hypothetical protein
VHGRLALLVLSLVPRLAASDGPAVLTVDKVARFEKGHGMVRVGRDPRLAGAPAPTCPTTSSVELSSYPVATQRVAVATRLTFDCGRWKRKRGSFRYDDPSATGGVRAIRYGKKGMRIRFAGGSAPLPAGPVGYLQVWLTVGSRRFNARFHNFVANAPDRLVTRKPSAAAATGERAFWAVLHRDWNTPSQKSDLEAVAVGCLTKASKHDKRDGRSRFLLAMTHLYRFGQAVERYDAFSAFARGEIEAAHAAFEEALPLLWNGTTGDSRVPGFAAATTFELGVVRNDPALQAQGMAELDAAFQVNPFFNVFDYIPVAQAVPALDPRFQSLFDKVRSYLDDPATLQCLTTQPEICADAGYAPRNTAGSLALFGDLEAKGGDLAGARGWYDLALAFGSSGTPPYPFLPALQARVNSVADRVARFRDADPGNDPTIIGAGAEACAACHNR